MIEQVNNFMMPLDQSRMNLVLFATAALENIQKKQPGPSLLTFWGNKGIGKTMLLKHIAHNIKINYRVQIVEMWDIEHLAVEEIQESLTDEIKRFTNDKSTVLILDNLDSLLRRDKNSQSFFDVARDTILPILEKGNVLIVASSQIELNQWREDDVRVRQINLSIPALTIEEINAFVSSAGIKVRGVYDLTFGQPMVAGWLLENPLMSEKEIADRASVYFLEDIPAEARQIAEIICLLPIFNAYLLQKILNSDASKSEVQYLECLEWLKEYIRRGLVYWDVSIGSYRFTDSAVRRLLARQAWYEKPDLFRKAQQIAAEYFQAEARGPGYLHMHLVGAVYHIAQTLHGQPSEKIGDECLKWVRSHLTSWSSASWSEVALAWENGAGEQAVREEIVHAIGIEYFDLITQEIKRLMKNMEMTK